MPRKNRLRLRFLVSFEQLASPPDCAFAHKTWSGRTCADVRNADELDECLELLKFVPRLTSSDLMDDSDEDIEDDDS